MKKILLTAPLLLLVLMTAIVFPKTADRRGLTVHEWGTFTSIAGADGSATPWRTYGGTEDLPCFVNKFGGFKFQVPGTVRMETPVVYFYGSRESVVDVNVSFPNGTITEWYPRQTSPWSNASIAWQGVHVIPEAKPDFPIEQGTSHYYAARDTDAAPLRVGSQTEKFLFYRGVGSFPLPISAKATADGKVVVNNRGANRLDGVFLFENRGGKRRYLFADTINGEVTLDRESLQDNWAGLLMDLERTLIDHGLYQREARAMIETWRDSWFEEGTRLIYIVPRQTIDSVLTLNIKPAPLETTRVFVGRMEIITPEIQDDVKAAIAHSDRSTLEKYGRFLEPIARQIGARNELLDSIYNSYGNRVPDCRN
jgi:hypothetical protein